LNGPSSSRSASPVPSSHRARNTRTSRRALEKSSRTSQRHCKQGRRTIRANWRGAKENQRIFYVTLTRAKSLLILPDSLRLYGNSKESFRRSLPLEGIEAAKALFEAPKPRPVKIREIKKNNPAAYAVMVQGVRLAPV